MIATIKINNDVMKLSYGDYIINTYYQKNNIDKSIQINAEFIGNMVNKKIKQITQVDDTTWEIEYQSYADSVFSEMGL